jgi:hypothetical protein
MKTAVEAIFAGKDRRYNRRFLQMCSHWSGLPISLEWHSRNGGTIPGRFVRKQR